MKMKIAVLIRAYKNLEYFDRCIDSVLMQNYQNYCIYYIDDCSGLSKKEKTMISDKLHRHKVFFNHKRKFSVHNAHLMNKLIPSKNSTIVVALDGDDWLISKNAFSMIAKQYEKGALLTYGGSDDLSDHRIIGKRYSQGVESKKLFRKEPFRISHLKTWKADLFDQIPRSHLLRSGGTWIRYCEDQAIFYSLLELAGPRYSVINKKIYHYNKHGRSDVQTNEMGVLLDEIEIRKKTTIDSFYL